MANIIAVIWDCDKTLIDGYMQDPIFAEYQIDSSDFWKKVNAKPMELAEKGIRVNRDTYYLNYFIECAHNGTFKGLNNQKLNGYGKKQKFYRGIPEIFEKTKNIFKDNKSYAEYGIQVEHYIVSTGFAEIIRGSDLMPFVDGVWGCELLETPDSDGDMVIGETVYTIDNTSKTRAIFEINKGIDKIDGIEVNSKIPEENRRVHFENMIYIADGPSDIPAFSVVKKGGGTTSIPKVTAKPCSRLNRCARMDASICTQKRIIPRGLPHICGLPIEFKEWLIGFVMQKKKKS